MCHPSPRALYPLFRVPMCVSLLFICFSHIDRAQHKCLSELKVARARTYISLRFKCIKRIVRSASYICFLFGLCSSFSASPFLFYLFIFSTTSTKMCNSSSDIHVCDNIGDSMNFLCSLWFSFGFVVVLFVSVFLLCSLCSPPLIVCVPVVVVVGRVLGLFISTVARCILSYMRVPHTLAGSHTHAHKHTRAVVGCL